jgi:hypothetical protein
MRQWQVEWFDRFNERERIEIFDDFRAAHIHARKMSRDNDADSVVMALDDFPDGGKTVTGHMEYSFGLRGEKQGSCVLLDWPIT